VETFALRLRPEMDLRLELTRFAQTQPLRAGFVLTAVGSLAQACLRYAGADQGVLLPGPWEMVGLVGTLCPTGVHLHTCLADSTGRVVGGHVMAGCLVYTTCELVLGDCRDYCFERSPDPKTGFYELQLRSMESGNLC